MHWCRARQPKSNTTATARPPGVRPTCTLPHTRGGTVLRGVAVFRYLRDTYRCWRCGRKCTGRPAVVVIRRVNLVPRQKQQNRRAAGYWGGEPTYAPLAQARPQLHLPSPLTHTLHTVRRLVCSLLTAWAATTRGTTRTTPVSSKARERRQCSTQPRLIHDAR
jgi:hypothetical protein